MVFLTNLPHFSSHSFFYHDRLNQRVTNLVYDEVNGLVKVFCDDGTIYTGERVQLSLGVLQSDLVEFNPALPDWNIERALLIAHGTIYMKFPETFRDDKQHFM